MVRWQRADTEYHYPLGQTGDGLGLMQTGQQLLQQTGAVRVAVAGQLAPEQCLPGFVRAEVLQLVALPGGQPVVAIQQVLVEYVGDLHGKRQPSPLITAFQIMSQARRSEEHTSEL